MPFIDLDSRWLVLNSRFNYYVHMSDLWVSVWVFTWTCACMYILSLCMVSYVLMVELSLFPIINTLLCIFSKFFFDLYYVYILSFHIAFTFHTYSDVIMVPSFDLFRLLTIRRLLCPNKWHNHNSCFESLFLWSTLPLWLSRAMIPTKYMLFDSHATLYICSLM